MSLTKLSNDVDFKKSILRFNSKNGITVFDTSKSEINKLLKYARLVEFTIPASINFFLALITDAGLNIETTLAYALSLAACALIEATYSLDLIADRARLTLLCDSSAASIYADSLINNGARLSVTTVSHAWSITDCLYTVNSSGVNGAPSSSLRSKSFNGWLCRISSIPIPLINASTRFSLAPPSLNKPCGVF